MPYCLNPECPHRKKTGKPAEFLEGYTECSDCGSRLSEEIPADTIVSKKKYIPANISPDFYKRLLVTLGAVALWRLINHFPVPGIHFDGLKGFLNTASLLGFDVSASVLTLGLRPYIYAYILVEVLALFVPQLKSWRAGGYAGRSKLHNLSKVLTLVFALIGGYIFALNIESIYRGMAVYNPGLGFRIIAALTLTAGTFIMILLADLITKRGIGHGISIIVISSYAVPGCWKVIQYLTRILEANPMYHINNIVNTILLLIVLPAATALIVMVEKSHHRVKVEFSDGLEAYMPLKLTTGGTEPEGWALGLIMLPVTIANFTATQSLQNITGMLTPGQPGYFVTYFFLLVFIYYIFTSFFYQPAKLSEFLHQRNACFKIPSGEEKDLDRVLEIMAFLGAIYLFLFALIAEALLVMGFFIGSVVFITFVVIVMDLLGEARLRIYGNVENVCELHDVPKAGLLKSILEQRGIPI